MPLLRFITALFILVQKIAVFKHKMPLFSMPQTAKKLFLYEFVVFGLQRLIWSILNENDIFMIVVFAGINPFWSLCALKRQNCRKWSSIAVKRHAVSFLTHQGGMTCPDNPRHTYLNHKPADGWHQCPNGQGQHQTGWGEIVGDKAWAGERSVHQGFSCLSCGTCVLILNVCISHDMPRRTPRLIYSCRR